MRLKREGSPEEPYTELRTKPGGTPRNGQERRHVKLWLEVFGELERKEPEELQKVLRKLEELNSK